MSPVWDTIKLRGGTAAEWTTANPILADREVGVEKDTRKLKIGDGVTHWVDLLYVVGVAAGTTVSSVNTKTGAVSLVASDVGADASGAATAASSAAYTAAVSTAASDATSKVGVESARALAAEALLQPSISDSNGHITAASAPLLAQRDRLTLLSSYFAEPFPRAIATVSSALVSGTMQGVAVPLLKGQVVSKIAFHTGTTAANGPLNQWFALWSSALALIGTTTDDAGAPWTANTTKSLNMVTPYTVPADGLYIVTCLVTVSTTPPSILSFATNAALAAEAPALNGRDLAHTSLTNLASAPSTVALTASTILPWCAVG